MSVLFIHHTNFWIVWYVYTRPYSRFLAGVPAAVVVTAAIMTLVSSPVSTEVLARRYADSIASTGLTPESRTLAIDRLLQLKPRDSEIHFLRAEQIAKRQGDRLAEPLMRQLATFDRQANPAAHWWLAEYLRRNHQPHESRTLDSIRQHLEACLFSTQWNDKAHRALAHLEMSCENWRAAIKHLESVATTNPDYLLPLASVYRRLGEQDQATAAIERSIERHTAIVQQFPLRESAVIRLGETLLQADRSDEALTTLHKLHDRRPTPQLSTAIARAHYYTFEKQFEDQLAVTKSSDGPTTESKNSTLEVSASRIELLETVIRFDPTHVKAQTAIARLATESSPEAEKARTLLKDLLTAGRSTATIHLILGTDAIRKNQLPAAKLHFELALRDNPQLLVAANNLAHSLITLNPRNAPHALEISDRAVAGAPNHPAFRVTRAEILMTLDRPHAAIADLERALAVRPSHAPTHSLLGRAYRAVGELELAERHEKLANQ